jgi:hypothetical protein
MAVRKTVSIAANVAPILLMIALIPLVSDDYALTALYGVIIIAAFIIKRKRRDLAAFGFGLIGMFFSEWLFIATGVETFTRNSLFGLMPLWLPFLWAYGFVVIKRSLEILG